MWGEEGVDIKDIVDMNIATTKQLAHFGQLAKSGKFQQFDYYFQDKNLNMQSYNSTIIIPEIPLEDIDEDLPIYLYVGLSDDFTSVEDV